jgi:TRAP-type uncharacterized transport system substrate-binding protein
VAAARIYQRKWVLIKLPIAVLAAAAILLLWHFLLPMPPTELALSSGRSDGVYHLHAQRYAQEFARHGVTLHVHPSEGSDQNLERLRGRAQPAVDLAFVQGGSGYVGAETGGGERVETIARVDIEPLWIFSRLAGLDALQQLQGLRLSLGPRGSGGRRLALQLLEQVRLQPKDWVDSDKVGMEAARALTQGQLDAMVLVAAPQSPVVRALIQAPGVYLVQLRRSAALTERLPYLQPRLLPQGTLDTGGRWPPQDTTVLVTMSSLLARADLHPALQRLAAQVALDVHGGAGVFHAAGTLPTLKRIEFPASDEARQVLLRGLPWLERQLPFWWSQVALRLLVIGLPVALLAFWAARIVPAYLRWLLESRVARWYGELKYIEDDLERDAATELDLNKYNQRLAAIERRMADFVTPPYLMPRWFTLRQHVDFVRARLLRRRGR